MKTSNPAAAAPAPDSGRKTVKKPVARSAPSVCAACTSCMLMPRMIGNIVMTASGSIACTMPISTPVSDGASVPALSISPRCVATTVSRPVFESSSIHAYVLTR